MSTYFEKFALQEDNPKEDNEISITEEVSNKKNKPSYFEKFAQSQDQNQDNLTLSEDVSYTPIKGMFGEDYDRPQESREEAKRQFARTGARAVESVAPNPGR